MTDDGFPSRDELEASQLMLLRRLFVSVIPSNAFQTRKLEAMSSRTLDSLASFFAGVPFTTKSDLVEDHRANPPFGSNLTFPSERYTRFSQTSGTSGEPLRWLDTTESWSWMVDNWAQVFRASGVGQEDRIFFAFSFGPFLGFWTAFEAGVRIGALCLPGGGMSSAARALAILDNRATVLCCTPTYAVRLGEVAREEGLDSTDSPIRTLIIAGEPGAGIPAVRSRIKELWPGAKVRDHHGMTEVGPVTYECPLREGVLHVIESSFIPEVIDPETGAHINPGEEGELVLTNLGRTGSPLIRYRTGDLVHLAKESRCACGRYDMALEGGILARTDDMVVIRGVNLYPAAVEAVVRRFPQIAEFRVLISSANALAEATVQIEPSKECSHPEVLSRELETSLRAAFNLRIPVELVQEGDLPRFELKSRRWVHSEGNLRA